MKITRQRAWILYGWANSAYALPVLAAFFPILFTEYWGATLSPSAAFSWLGAANSWAGFVVAVASPFAAAFASTSGRRKSYLIFWALAGIVSTAGLSLIGVNQWGASLALFVVSQVSFQLSVLFYDTLLYDVSTEQNRHLVSAKGFAYGYLGGVLLFLGNSAILRWHEQLPGIDGVYHAAKVSLICAAVWWLVFAQPLFCANFTPKVKTPPPHRFRRSLALLKDDLNILLGDRNILFFIIAYWFYINGVLTLISMSSGMALAIGVSNSAVIVALIFVQFAAFPCSLLAGRAASRGSARRVLLLLVGGYSILVASSLFFLRGTYSFFLLALGVGMLQGGTQAVSRSYFLSLIPGEKQTSFFGIYSMVGRFSMILGPAIISLITYGLTQFFQYRYEYTLIHIYYARTLPVRAGFSSIALFFLIGWLFLYSIGTCSAGIENRAEA
ncbi:MFS transporter [Chitinivibrio alkaliphilus]|uniref:Transporter, major facilitator family protein n=1 Tax=Chitinivibrio alkaliphilus ACht1 TaxID=1313304 RepID=U7DE02_9BACT|nr:MFS transporter [Chitinivibrio alkaliphilus]ERP39141.1 transporter, major facilitator family protein [Chitinivibrio alkaliphilus ACht1]